MKGIEIINGEVFEWSEKDHSKDADRFVEAIVNCFHEQEQAYKGLGISLPSPIILIGGDKFIIPTRVAKNSSRSLNGGDYNEWTEISVHGEWVKLADQWSAEWDRLEYGGECRRFQVWNVPHLLSLAVLQYKTELLYR